MPDADYEREGFAYLHEHATGEDKRFGNFDREHFDWWRRSGGAVWVVEFELVDKPL
jgi:hypothetical protein